MVLTMSDSSPPGDVELCQERFFAVKQGRSHESSGTLLNILQGTGQPQPGRIMRPECCRWGLWEALDKGTSSPFTFIPVYRCHQEVEPSAVSSTIPESSFLFENSNPISLGALWGLFQGRRVWQWYFVVFLNYDWFGANHQHFKWFHNYHFSTD